MSDSQPPPASRYNAYITFSEIPLAAYDYVVNGKSSLYWVIEQSSPKSAINHFGTLCALNHLAHEATKTDLVILSNGEYR